MDTKTDIRKLREDQEHQDALEKARNKYFRWCKRLVNKKKRQHMENYIEYLKNNPDVDLSEHGELITREVAIETAESALASYLNDIKAKQGFFK